jgi:trk system potassium uptake protein TrkA
VVDHIELAGDLDFALVKAPSGFYGKTLRELDVRKRYGVTVVAVRRSSAPETEASRVPSPEYVVKEGDLLYLVGSEQDLEGIAEMEA